MNPFAQPAAHWRKSTHSSSQGGQCSEIADLSAAHWHRRSRSSQDRQDCVEVAVLVVRDSKDPDGPKLILTQAAWRNLVARARGRA
ncbi:DUF397 domain-containing protein [Actinomadura harenae]|uniref:DUF397 domain-containing protein n=1 Tax=Actinomadura harenae TaxID=2483351 RepID=A0A3M2M259_9ACTN|nr:DUF397 domain-containing protein [Actinomadura harenae]RMI42565.1 DUF397 domain-containing protein [Actinomadura harenae]